MTNSNYLNLFFNHTVLFFPYAALIANQDNLSFEMVFKKSRRLGIRVPECHAQSPRLDPKNRSVQSSSTWEVEVEPGIQGNPQLYMEFQASRCCFKNNLTKHRIATSPSLSNSTQAQLCLPSSCSRPLTFSS